MTIYIFIVEHGRMEHVGLAKTTRAVHDLPAPYVKFFALFMKVEWKPIPHNSKITIEDLVKRIHMRIFRPRL